MRELSACDFCGGEAAGVYEVVPGDIPGVSARRMVLCDGCRDTLADIVDPLLDAGRAGGRAKAERSSGSQPAASADEDGRTGELAADTEMDAEAETEPGAGPDSEPDAAPGPAADPESAAEPEAAPSVDPGSESTPDAEPVPESNAEPDDESAEPERVERPAEYGKVVRLVENRDAGIPRDDLEELATSAYGLSHVDVEEAIDFALEQGTFEETSSGLKTT